LKSKFDLNSNCFVIYKTDLKKKKDFLFKIGIWAESMTRPSRPASWPNGLTGAHCVVDSNLTR
jgi:hypothetical protein